LLTLQHSDHNEGYRMMKNLQKYNVIAPRLPAKTT
jgi:hypothetical protein